MKEDLYYQLIMLLSKNDIRVNQEELNLQLLSHPSYPSLHALTGVLDHFNIQNIAIDLPRESEMLAQLPNSFIAHIKSVVDSFVLVEKNANNYLIHYDDNKTVAIGQNEFLEIWNGVTLVVEKDESIKKYSKPSIIDTLLKFLIVILCFLLAFFVYKNASIYSFLHFFLSLTGLYFGIATIKHELGIASKVSGSMCNLSEETSCDQVLNSKGAQLFGFLKLSDISVVTFSTFILTWLLLFLTNDTNSPALVILSLFAIPVIFYSVYYQYFIVKKWCPLCMSIALVLFLQAVLCLIVDFQYLSFALQNTLLFLISSLTIIIVCSFLLPRIRKQKKLEKLELEYYQFKRKFSLFNAIYSVSESVEKMIPINGEIAFGEKDAPIQLIIITNPFCYYCKEMHRDLILFMKSNADQIRITIRFNVDTNNTTDKTHRLSSILLEIYNKEGSQELLKVLNEVYADDVDLEKWIARRTVPMNSYEDILSAQRSWCQANGINFTPMMLVNGKIFPKEYAKRDLLYFIDDLIEQG